MESFHSFAPIMFERCSLIIAVMPTKKKRINIVPDNLPSLTSPEQTCPSLYTGQKLAEKDPEKYGRIVQSLGEGKPLSRIAKNERGRS